MLLTPPLAVTGADASEFSIQVQPSSTVTASDSTTFVVRFSPTSTGTKSAMVTIGSNSANENPYIINLTGSAGKIPANISLGGLMTTYDGNPKQVVPYTQPATLKVDLTYNGSPYKPVDAGKYVVVATIDDPSYFGSVTDTLVIDKAQANIALDGLSASYDGNSKPVVASTTPEGLAVDLTYNGETTAPSEAGTYNVVATVIDNNYMGTATGELVIAKTNADIMLGELSAIYDGDPKPVSVATTPEGLTVNLTYNGSADEPVDAGKYIVNASIDDNNYSGTFTDTLVIEKATGTIDLTGLTATYDGNSHEVMATTIPTGLALELTYDGNVAAPTNAGTYPVIATINEANYMGSVTGQLVIDKAAVTVTFDSLMVVSTGSPKPATVTTSPEGLSVDITYDGSMTAPSDTGTYAIVATITDPNYQGSASGSYVISAPATPTAVNNMAFKEQVKVYPTITRDVVHVELDNSRFDVAVYNISGQKLKLVKGAKDNLVLNMSNYHPGMYILKIKVGDQAVSKRVIRQ